MDSRNETGQSEIAMQALGWISLAEQRAKNKAKVMFKICFKKFFMAWHRLHYQISLQTPTQPIVIIILEIQLKTLKRDFFKKKSKLQWSQDME